MCHPRKSVERETGGERERALVSWSLREEVRANEMEEREKGPSVLSLLFHGFLEASDTRISAGREGQDVGDDADLGGEFEEVLPSHSQIVSEEDHLHKEASKACEYITHKGGERLH